MGGRCFVAGLVLLAFASVAAAQTYLPPPAHAPAWWKVPGDAPDDMSRSKYASFITDPDSNTAPDYTYNGYAPQVADDWTVGGTFVFGVDFATDPADSAWGDGEGLEIQAAGSQLELLMGNLGQPMFDKEYFVQVAWRPVDGVLDEGDEMGLVVATEAGSVVEPGLAFVETDANGWVLQTWSGAIRPQPAWETFTFVINDDAQIDSIWTGTMCPEPGSLAILAAGAGLIRRRRRR
jgi:hypothetical protein